MLLEAARFRLPAPGEVAASPPGGSLATVPSVTFKPANPHTRCPERFLSAVPLTFLEDPVLCFPMTHKQMFFK